MRKEHSNKLSSCFTDILRSILGLAQLLCTHTKFPLEHCIDAHENRHDWKTKANVELQKEHGTIQFLLVKWVKAWKRKLKL